MTQTFKQKLTLSNRSVLFRSVTKLIVNTVNTCFGLFLGVRPLLFHLVFLFPVNYKCYHCNLDLCTFHYFLMWLKLLSLFHEALGREDWTVGLFWERFGMGLLYGLFYFIRLLFSLFKGIYNRISYSVLI